MSADATRDSIDVDDFVVYEWPEPAAQGRSWVVIRLSQKQDLHLLATRIADPHLITRLVMGKALPLDHGTSVSVLAHDPGLRPAA